MANPIVARLTKAVVGAAVVYLLYRVYWELTIGRTRSTMKKRHGCKPLKHYARGGRLIGLQFFRELQYHMAHKTLLQRNKERFAEEGMTFSALVPGAHIISTIEPENLKTIMSLDFKNYSLDAPRKQAMRLMLGKGIFDTDGAEWAHSREMLRPNFVRSQVGDLGTFERHVQHFLDAIPRDASTVDLQDLFFRLTMDSATEILFGESTHCLAPGISTDSGTAFTQAWNRAVEETGDRVMLGPLAYLKINRQFGKDVKYLNDYIDAFVDKALALYQAEKLDDGGRYVFLHELVRQTTDRVQIRSELLNILLAGRDTTASLLSNIFFELSKRPDIWAKLRVEVDTLGGEKPTLAQLRDLKYLRWVLNESLRLYPVVPMNRREAMTDTVLPVGGGADGASPVFVPKGTLVSWSAYSLHRRKDFYGEDAEEFKPERWALLRPGWEYLPFNGGPRICIGQQFALVEASYTTVRLLQRFSSIECRDPNPWIENVSLTCTGQACHVAMIPREG